MDDTEFKNKITSIERRLAELEKIDAEVERAIFGEGIPPLTTEQASLIITGMKKINSEINSLAMGPLFTFPLPRNWTSLNYSAARNEFRNGLLSSRIKLATIKQLRERAKRQTIKRSSPPPLLITVPNQENAIHLGVNENGEIFSDGQYDDVDDRRINALKPGLLRLIDQAHGELNLGNKFYGFLADVLNEYRAGIDKPANEIDFGILFTLGTELNETLTEARLKDADKNLPDLSGKAAAKVESILIAHQPFMLSSELGVDLVVATELYSETPEQLSAGRAATDRLRQEIEDSEGVFEENTKGRVVAGLTSGDVKATIFSRRVAKNVGIVCAGVAACAAAPAIGLVSAGGAAAVTVLSGVGLIFGSGKVLNAGKNLAKETPADIAADLGRIRDFTIEKKDILAKAIFASSKNHWFHLLLSRVWETRTAEQINNELIELFSNSPSPEVDVEQLFSGIAGNKVEWDLFVDRSQFSFDHDNSIIHCQLSDGGHVITCFLHPGDMNMLLDDDPKQGAKIRLRGTLRDRGDLYDCNYLGIISRYKPPS